MFSRGDAIFPVCSGRRLPYNAASKFRGDLGGLFDERDCAASCSGKVASEFGTVSAGRPVDDVRSAARCLRGTRNSQIHLLASDRDRSGLADLACLVDGRFGGGGARRGRRRDLVEPSQRLRSGGGNRSSFWIARSRRQFPAAVGGRTRIVDGRGVAAGHGPTGGVGGNSRAVQLACPLDGRIAGSAGNRCRALDARGERHRAASEHGGVGHGGSAGPGTDPQVGRGIEETLGRTAEAGRGERLGRR